MALSLRRIEERLARLAPEEPPPGQRAAVAAVLRSSAELEPEVLLMKRAERDGDRWSGHVSFPGGREDERDRDLFETALRETREEVGLDLARSGRLLGRLDPLKPIMGGGIVVAPFVFAVTEEAPLALGDEAEFAFWFPLARAARGELDDLHHYRKGGMEAQFPCWRYQGCVVWGLTYRMLKRLLEIAVRRDR